MPAKARAGLFFLTSMPSEPPQKRSIVFVDGQNLFHAAREAFGYTFPNYDILALAQAICSKHAWIATQTRFYTGIPDASDDAFWHHFWTGKLRIMSQRGVQVFSRPLRYRNKKVRLRDGTIETFLSGEEKGIDVRIALDVIRLARQNLYDVGIIFSQDQDLSEVAEEIRVLAREQDRWIKVVSVFPSSPTSRNKRGINKTDWIKIDRATYDACIDHRNYRPKPAGS